MRTTLRALLSLSLLPAFTANAQFDRSNVEFWVGAGADSSVLVVDFQDGSDDASYAWGFLHDGTVTGLDMVNAIAAADVDLTIDLVSGFLNSITYGGHAGIGGSPNYWSTWSGTGMADMAMNGGLSEPLANGSWFGCSYTDFDPPLIPREPVAAFEPLRFTLDDVEFWVGTGQDTALLVVDFQDGTGHSSYAWGFAFDGSTTGEDMINAIADADPSLTASLVGGFLSDMTYGEHTGIGGAPNYWSTWSGTNLGDWSMNLGASTTVSNGDLFGCSYTDFNPALRPYYPVAATFATGIVERTAPATLSVFPQPATDLMTIRSEAPAGTAFRITDLTGKVVYAGRTEGLFSTVPVGTFATGLYLLQVGDTQRMIAVN